MSVTFGHFRQGVQSDVPVRHNPQFGLGVGGAAVVGPGGVTLAKTFTPGRTVSDAILIPSAIQTPGAYFGEGAMSAAYGGVPQSVDYSATAIFDFTAPATSISL